MPPPDEVLVHIDAGDRETEPLLSRSFPSVRILRSESRQGPGGGRNKLIAAAVHEIVASFDDDSYPLDRDYFARLCATFAAMPDADVIASRIVERGSRVPEATAEIGRTVLFGGGGVAYRRNAFLATGGYVPLAVAYGMEEVDLGMRLTDRGKNIYVSNWLRVFHDSDLARHDLPHVTAGSIANIALLVFLRYPPSYWPYGTLQLVNRIIWLVRVGRLRGIASGIGRIPRHLWEHRRLRETVSRRGLSLFLRERRAPVQFQALGF